jgi:hypothetical protein
MTDEQYNQIFKDLGIVIDNQKIICAKLDRLQGDMNVVINNQLITERNFKEFEKKTFSKLQNITNEVNEITEKLKGKSSTTH